jgi:hypothetical protein
MGLALCAIRPLLLPTIQIARVIQPLFILWIAGYVLPVMNQHRYSQNNIHISIFHWAREEIARTNSRTPLVITYQERLWSIYGYSSLSLTKAATRLPQIEFHRGAQTFDDVFLIQHFFDDPSTRQKIPLKGSRFVDGVGLETVAEKSFYPFNLARISRIKAIDLDRALNDKSPQEQCEVYRDVRPEELKTWKELLP